MRQEVDSKDRLYAYRNDQFVFFREGHCNFCSDILCNVYVTSIPLKLMCLHVAEFDAHPCCMYLFLAIVSQDNYAHC